ncbi:MAG TPA: hypothetical protein PKY81_03625 [bacterium]|nr:hypothetical protein [bacterium]
MAYSESDYICLIRKISELYEDKTKTPLQVYFLIKKLLAIYSKIPAYPINAVQILENSDKPVSKECLEKGDYIFAETEKDCISGVIKDKTEQGTIKLGDISKQITYRSKTLNLSDLKNVYCVQEKKDYVRLEKRIGIKSAVSGGIAGKSEPINQTGIIENPPKKTESEGGKSESAESGSAQAISGGTNTANNQNIDGGLKGEKNNA